MISLARHCTVCGPGKHSRLPTKQRIERVRSGVLTYFEAASYLQLFLELGKRAGCLCNHIGHLKISTVMKLGLLWSISKTFVRHDELSSPQIVRLDVRSSGCSVSWAGLSLGSMQIRNAFSDTVIPHALSQYDTPVAIPAPAPVSVPVSVPVSISVVPRPRGPPLRCMLLIHLVAHMVLLQDLPAEVQKDFVDIRASPSRGLEVWFLTPGLCQLEGTGTRYSSVVLHIGFVADHDKRNIIVLLDARDLLSKLGEFVERVRVGNREDKQEALALLHVEFSHSSELLRACRIENFKHNLLSCRKSEV